MMAAFLGYDYSRGYAENFVDLPSGNDIMTINAAYNQATAMNDRKARWSIVASMYEHNSDACCHAAPE